MRPSSQVIPKGSDLLLCNGVSQAAHELSQFIGEMATSAPLPVVVDDGHGGSNSSLPGNRIFVGAVPWALDVAGFDAATLEQEAITVFAHNSSWLFVLGRSDGRDGDRHQCGSDWSARNDTLHSAYTLLESLGVHWVGPYAGGNIVPRRAIVSAPVGGVPLKQAPRLLKRQIRKIYKSALSYPNVPWLNQSVFDALNANETLWLQRMRLGQHDTPPWGQAFETWWKRYGSTHPEYFALNPDGKRGPLSASKPDRVKMCVSNPDLWHAVASGGTNHNPFGLSAAEDDSNWGFCQCDKCKAWDADSRANSSTGKYSDRYARFWTNIWKLLAKANPTDGTNWVTAYGYDSYRDPPANVQLEGNIMIGYVGFDYPALPNETALEYSRWSGWTEAGAKHLFLRPNSLITGQGFPYIFSAQLATDFQFTAQHGLIATDFDSLMNHWGAVGPMYYVLARLHWQPDALPETFLTEYYSSFEQAGPPIRAYHEWIERWTQDTFTSASARLLVSKRGNSSGWFPNVRRIFTADVIRQAKSMVAAAELMCTSELSRTRVQLIAAAVEHAHLTVLAFNATVSAGDCYGPCMGGSPECVYGNTSVPCLATAGAGPQVLRRIISASKNLTEYRIKIAPLNAVNVYWAENAERIAVSYFPGRDYNGAQVTADASTIPEPWVAHSLLPSVGWSFAIDPLNIGLHESWGMPNSSAVWNSTAIISNKGWCCGRVPAVSDHHGGAYKGVGWYRIAFDVGESDSTTNWAAAFTSFNGSISVWLNGVSATSQSNLLWRFANTLLPSTNTLIVRLDAQHKAGGGLTGRVFISHHLA